MDKWVGRHVGKTWRDHAVANQGKMCWDRDSVLYASCLDTIGFIFLVPSYQLDSSTSSEEDWLRDSSEGEYRTYKCLAGATLIFRLTNLPGMPLPTTPPHFPRLPHARQARLSLFVLYSNSAGPVAGLVTWFCPHMLFRRPETRLNDIGSMLGASDGLSPPFPRHVQHSNFSHGHGPVSHPDLRQAGCPILEIHFDSKKPQKYLCVHGRGGTAAVAASFIIVGIRAHFVRAMYTDPTMRQEKMPLLWHDDQDSYALGSEANPDGEQAIIICCEKCYVPPMLPYQSTQPSESHWPHDLHISSWCRFPLIITPEKRRVTWTIGFCTSTW